jgi:hypothetical protein
MSLHALPQDWYGWGEVWIPWLCLAGLPMGLVVFFDGTNGCYGIFMVFFFTFFKWKNTSINDG